LKESGNDKQGRKKQKRKGENIPFKGNPVCYDKLHSQKQGKNNHSQEDEHHLIKFIGFRGKRQEKKRKEKDKEENSKSDKSVYHFIILQE